MSFLKPEVIFRDRISLYFFSSNITYFLHKQPIKAQIFRLSTARLKFTKFLMSFFKQKVSFIQSLDSFFSVMRDNSSVLFQLNLYTLLTKQHSQVQIFRLATACIKINPIPHSCLEPRVSFSSNFASLFIVTRHNSSVIFHLNICMLWTKGAHQSPSFQTFDCSHENKPNSLCHFSSHESLFL